MSLRSDTSDWHQESPMDAALALLPGNKTVPPLYRRVVETLDLWGAPQWLGQVGLVMRATERGIITPSQIGGLLGSEAEEVATALSRLRQPLPRPSLQPIEPSWRLFMTTYRNPAAGILKVAELLAQLNPNNTSDLTVKPETIHAAAAVCALLGIWEMRALLLTKVLDLEDPSLARQTAQFLQSSQADRIAFFEECRERLQQLLASKGIRAMIERRHRWLHAVAEDGIESFRGGLPFADVVEIEVDSVTNCYQTLIAINQAFQVHDSHLRDYIGCPKPNGYQALHTTIEIKGPERMMPVAIRIMTPNMRRYNREGFLAHLMGIITPNSSQVWWNNRDRWLAIDSGRTDEIFVFTPKAEAQFLTPQSTVIDFAVRIHRDLGVYCRGALINGLRVPPGEVLQNGDVCNVLIEHRHEPIDRHLLERATTNMARNRIRNAMNRDTSSVNNGQAIFQNVLQARLMQLELQVDATTIEPLLRETYHKRGYHSTDAYYRAVARGEAAPDQVVRLIAESLLGARLDLSALPSEIRTRARRVRLAQCCWPGVNAAIVAVPVHSGHELKIHRSDCPHVREAAFPIGWKPAPEQSVVADAIYEGWDRPGLILRLTNALKDVTGLNIKELKAQVPEPSFARISFTFEVPHHEQVEQVKQALEQLPERRHVDIRTVMLTDGGSGDLLPLKNPYGPHPVGSWPLFVGRKTEVQTIITHLGDKERMRHILIRGPKRIGKSSLLDHLARYHLPAFTVPATLDLQSLPTEELRLPLLLHRMGQMIARKVGTRFTMPVPAIAALNYDPISTFASFLEAAQTDRDLEQFVVLLDELGVVVSRLRGTAQGHEFFDQWRALLNDPRVYRQLAFVVVIPDALLAEMTAEEVPNLPRIGELGLPIRLSVLDEIDARDLMTAPIKTHLEYRPVDLDRLVDETGGHPYYTHLLCSQIVISLRARQRKSGLHTREREVIPSELVQQAIDQVFANRDAYHHILADSSASTRAVLLALAECSNDTHALVSSRRLHTRLSRSGYGTLAITQALHDRPDLLYERDGHFGIRPTLVARWLRRNTS